MRDENRFDPWLFGDTVPDNETTKRMFSIAIGILVTETVTNHVYRYDSKILKQEEGGAIGLELVGVVANIYMCWWDKQLLVRTAAENMHIEVYKRYVDDINVDIDDYREDTTDEIVIKRVSEIADTIDPSIRSTFDYGSKYDDCRLPLLDLKMWIGRDTSGTWKILHCHYMKDVSSRYLIHAKSSHPYTMKLNVLVNEGLRILRNTSIYIGWEEARNHLQHFVNRMQFSGYDKTIKAKVIQKILQKYDAKIRTYNEVGKMYRSRKEQYDERRKLKDLNKSRWYNTEKYDSVLFVDVTKNSELMREVQQCCKKYKMKVKVVEKMGRTIKSELQRSNPFDLKSCGRNNCTICKLEMKIDCRTRGCVYEMTCKECSRKYRGQTGRSIFERVNEHFKAYTEKKEDSVLFQHSEKYHDGQEFQINIKIISRCFGKPTTRLITEAIFINELGDDETLNSRKEWSYVKLPRATITRY